MVEEPGDEEEEGEVLYPGRAGPGPFRLEDDVECSTTCPQNDGGVCIEGRENCSRRT